MNFKKYLILFVLLYGCSSHFSNTYINEDVTKSLNIADSLHLIWSKKLKGYPEQILQLNKDVIWVGDAYGGLMALDINTGSKIDKYWRYFNGPIKLYGIYDNVFYFSSESKYNSKKLYEILAWNIENAKFVWEQKYDAQYSNLLNLNKKIYLTNTQSISIINKLSGDIIKTKKFDETMSEHFLIWNNLIIGITEKGKLLLMDDNLDIKGKFNLKINLPKKISLQNDKLIAFNSDGNLRIFSLINKRIIFSKNYKNAIYSCPLIFEDIIIVPFAKGNVQAIDLTTENIKWEFVYDELLKHNIIMLDNALVVPYASGNIFCLDTMGNILSEYTSEKSINYIQFVNKGLLYSSKKKLYLIGVK